MAGIFNSAIFNNQVFNTGTATPADTHDGADSDSYKRYRKKLERLAKLADEHNQSKYIKQAVQAAEIVDELHVSAPAIESAATAIQKNQKPVLDFSAIQAELTRVRAYLDEMIDFREQEEEEETIIMMALN